MWPFRKHAVGVYISDRTVDIVELSGRGKKIHVRAQGKQILDAGIVERGRVLRPDLLKLSVEKALASATPKLIRAKKILAVLPDSQLYAQVIQLQPHPGADFAKELADEARKNIPLEAEDIVTSHSILVETGTGIDTLLIATSRTVLDEWRAFYNTCGLHPTLFDIEALAVYRGLDKSTATLPMCTVNIGAKRTDINIFDATGLRHMHQIEQAGENLTQLLVKDLAISYEEAELLKKTEGVAASSGRGFLSLTKGLEPIGKAVKEAVNGYRVNYQQMVNAIYIVGGTSQLPGIVDYIQAISDIPVHLGVPIIKHQEDMPAVESIGLAIRALSREWENDPAYDGERNLGKKTKPIVSTEHLNLHSEKQRMFLRINALFKRITHGHLFSFALIAVVLVIGFTVFTYWRDVEPYRFVSNAPVRPISPNDIVQIHEPPIATSTPPEVKEKRVTITETPTGWLNVRSGPGTEHAQIARVYPNETYPLIGEEGDWYHITIKDGISGWVSHEYAVAE